MMKITQKSQQSKVKAWNILEEIVLLDIHQSLIIIKMNRDIK